MIDIIREFYLKTILIIVIPANNEAPYSLTAISLKFSIHEVVFTESLN